MRGFDTSISFVDVFKTSNVQQEGSSAESVGEF
jgi:hypothetical protein